jgi:hypothetical protein
LIALVLAVLGATSFRPPPTSGPFARDFEAYYAAGATWTAGGDPWSRDIWRVERTITGVDATRDELLPFVGPAAALPLWSLFARLPFDVARTVWLTILVLALATLAFAATLLAGVRPGPIEAACVLLFCALTGPVISAIALGQVALVAAAAVAVAFALLERRPFGAIVAACLATLQPNVALALASRLTARGPALALLGAALLFAGATLVIGGGPAGAIAYLERLSAHGAGERFSLIQYGSTAIAFAFGAPPRAAMLAGDAVAIAALAVAAGAAFRLRAQPVFAAAIGIALLPLIVPFFHEHDFAIELVPAIVLAFSPERRARVLAAIGVTCTLVDWLGVAQRPHTTAQTACFAVALACLFTALARRSLQPALAPFVAVVLIAAVAIPLALAHPAPDWPDLLGPFHAGPGLDASAVWAAEQAATGLNAPEPAWGILRMIPLAGCVLFALAAALAARTDAVSALRRR